MPTADLVREKALSLAEAGAVSENAIRELLEYCEDRRVAVVLARQHLVEEQVARPSDPLLGRAVELLDRVLERLPVD
jgi:hypothetical protein